MVFLQSTGKYPASRLYYGTTTEIDRLPEGNLRVDLIFRDTTRCSATIRLRKGGINYLRMDSLVKEPADDRSPRAVRETGKNVARIAPRGTAGRL